MFQSKTPTLDEKLPPFLNNLNFSHFLNVLYKIKDMERFSIYDSFQRRNIFKQPFLANGNSPFNDFWKSYRTQHWNPYPYIHNQGRAYKQNIVGLGTGPGPTKRMAERYTNSRPESSNLMNVSNGSESNRDQHGYYGEHDEWGRRYQDRQHDDYQQEHQYDQPPQEQQHDGYQYSQQL